MPKATKPMPADPAQAVVAAPPDWTSAATVWSVTDTAECLPRPEFELDPQRDAIAEAFFAADPDGARLGRVFRDTLDQLYDGQHTGRFRWDQLFKTEKTHCGTLIEINLRRAFDDLIDDGDALDYRILGLDIDCKYSQTVGGWMLPPECFGHLLLVAHADDAKGMWNLGVVRASEANRRTTSSNRDGKTNLSPHGKQQIAWIFRNHPLPPNTLLSLDGDTLTAILAQRSGQKRVNELFRRVTNVRIGRNTVATVAQQDDYMKRVRDNGGARGILRTDGYLIPGGDYDSHRVIARTLGIEVPLPGEFVSVRVVPASEDDIGVVELDGGYWRAAFTDEVVTEPAPRLPTTRKALDL